MAHAVLLLDDEPSILAALRRTLAEPMLVGERVFRPTIEIFSVPALALARLQEKAFDLIISDYRMPEMNGSDFLKAALDIQPHAVRLILSGQTDFNGLVEAINKAQITHFIGKPWNDDELRQLVAQALADREQVIENLVLADKARVQQGTLTTQEAALRRLEAENPDIAFVNWGPDGSIRLEDI